MAGVKGKSGGHPNSGRKPSAYTQLKRKIETERTVDAERAFDLYVQVMDNPDEDLLLRMYAADWVTSRVMGKAKERSEIMSATAFDDVSKLTPEQRHKRIDELFRARGTRAAATPGTGTTGHSSRKSN